MKTRVISGAVLAAIGLITIWLGGPVLAAVLLFCSLVGMYELQKACGVIRDGEKWPALSVAGFAGAAFYDLFLLLSGRRFAVVIAAFAVMAVMMVYVLTFPKYHADQAIAVCFSFFYVTVMLGFILLIRLEKEGLILVWLVFLSSWVADTCAYFVGRAVGRHMMAPVLSPKKTWEGAAGGIAGAGISGALFALIFAEGRLVGECALICAVGAVISIFGDLAASAVKRDHSIKDYGNLIPGHGGIMDRFDSVIFTAPVIYFLSLLLVSGI